MINDCYKEYLDYLIGNVIETKPDFRCNEKRRKFFKNNEYKIILELVDWRLFIKEDIWYNFQCFFDLTYSETRSYFNEYFCEKMNLNNITPTVCKLNR